MKKYLLYEITKSGNERFIDYFDTLNDAIYVKNAFKKVFGDSKKYIVK